MKILSNLWVVIDFFLIAWVRECKITVRNQIFKYLERELMIYHPKLLSQMARLWDQEQQKIRIILTVLDQDNMLINNRKKRILVIALVVKLKTYWLRNRNISQVQETMTKQKNKIFLQWNLDQVKEVLLNKAKTLEMCQALELINNIRIQS